MSNPRLAAISAEPRRVIVVLVDFPNKHFDQAQNVKHFEDLFFSTGVIPTGSVNEYYKEVSNQLISISGQVIGPYTMPHDETYYSGFGRADADYGMQGAVPNVGTLANDAVSASKDAFNFAAYDNDKNGYVDAFIVVHAGVGAEVTSDKHDLWSVKYILPNAVTKDNTRIFGFLTVPADAKTGVCCHELGHLLFGWPDLYDISSLTYGVGNWCVMSTGTWLGAGNSPCHPSAWCKVNQGWVTVTNLEQSGSRELDSVEEAKIVQRVSPGNSALNREYYLLENRQQIGKDALIPGVGLLVWHIDDSVLYNNDAVHRRVDLKQADGLASLTKPQKLPNGAWNPAASPGSGGDPYPFHANNTLSSSSIPNSDSFAGQAIFTMSNISLETTKIYFDLELPVAATTWTTNAFMGQKSISTSSQIAVVSRGSENIEVFWIDIYRAIQHAWWSPEKGWTNNELRPAGTALTGAIAAVSRASNKLSVFWVGTNHSLQTVAWEEGKDWIQTQAAADNACQPETASLSVVSRRSDTMEVFWAHNTAFQHAWWYEGQSWAWGGLWGASPAPNSPVIAASARPSEMKVFGILSNGRVQQYSFSDPGGWIIWSSPSPQSVANGGLTALVHGEIEVFYNEPSPSKNIAGWMTSIVGPNNSFESFGGFAAAGNMVGLARNNWSKDVFYTTAGGGIRWANWREARGWKDAEILAEDGLSAGLALACVSTTGNDLNLWAKRRVGDDFSIINVWNGGA